MVDNGKMLLFFFYRNSLFVRAARGAAGGFLAVSKLSKDWRNPI